MGTAVLSSNGKSCLSSEFGPGMFLSGTRLSVLLAAIFMLALCWCCPASIAQVAPAEEGSPLHFAAGGAVSIINTDWAPRDMIGITAFADATYKAHYGIEVEGRTVQFDQWSTLREDTIGGGGRYVFPIGRFQPFAKGLIGIGSIDFPRVPDWPANYTHDTFFLYELGGGTDYNLTRKVALRAQYDYQFWPRWPPHGLSPRGITIGAVWQFK